MLSIKNSIILQMLSAVYIHIHAVSASIYIMSEIPYFSCNFDMGISYIPIFLSESIMYKITDFRFQ